MTPTMHAIDQIYAILLIVVWLSHVLQSRMWGSLFTDLFKIKAAAFVIAMFTLPFGLPIVVLHNRWAWEPAVIVTIVGWGWTIKGTLYLLYPQTPDLVRPRDFNAHHRSFIWAGLVLTLLGCAVGAQAFFGIGAPAA